MWERVLEPRDITHGTVGLRKFKARYVLAIGSSLLLFRDQGDVQRIHPKHERSIRPGSMLLVLGKAPAHNGRFLLRVVQGTDGSIVELVTKTEEGMREWAAALRRAIAWADEFPHEVGRRSSLVVTRDTENTFEWTVVKHGVLRKRLHSTLLTEKWAPRYVVLTQSQLQWYATTPEGRPSALLGEINLVKNLSITAHDGPAALDESDVGDDDEGAGEAEDDEPSSLAAGRYGSAVSFFPDRAGDRTEARFRILATNSRGKVKKQLIFSSNSRDELDEWVAAIRHQSEQVAMIDGLNKSAIGTRFGRKYRLLGKKYEADAALLESILDDLDNPRARGHRGGAPADVSDDDESEPELSAEDAARARFEAMRIDPLFAKYFKMISFGVPLSAVVQKLTADNIDAESIHIFVSGHGELDASAVAAGDIKPNGTTAEQKTRRKTPFRRVFFDTLPDTCTGAETIWAATPVLPLTLLSEDATELRVRFAAASSQKSSSPAKSKKPVQRLVDGKRLANLSIGIKVQALRNLVPPAS